MAEVARPADVADNRDAIVFNKKVDSRWNLKDFITFGKREDTLSEVEMESGHRLHVFPTHKVRFDVNKNNVIANKIVNNISNKYDAGPVENL